MLLVVATLFGILAVPASAASLESSGTVTVQQAGFGKYLGTTKGALLFDAILIILGCALQTVLIEDFHAAHILVFLGPAYNREPKTMGAFANGYPNRTLAQFKELHAGDVRGIASLTEDEYKYATQLAVWATCGQLAVPDTSFTAGRELFSATKIVPWGASVEYTLVL